MALLDLITRSSLNLNNPDVFMISGLSQMKNSFNDNGQFLDSLIRELFS